MYTYTRTSRYSASTSILQQQVWYCCTHRFDTFVFRNQCWGGSLIFHPVQNSKHELKVSARQERLLSVISYIWYSKKAAVGKADRGIAWLARKEANTVWRCFTQQLLLLFTAGALLENLAVVTTKMRTCRAPSLPRKQLFTNTEISRVLTLNI